MKDLTTQTGIIVKWFIAHIQAQGADGRLPGKVQGRLSLEPARQLLSLIHISGNT